MDRGQLSEIGTALAKHVAKAYDESDRIDDMTRLYNEAVYRKNELVTELTLSA